MNSTTQTARRSVTTNISGEHIKYSANSTSPKTSTTNQKSSIKLSFLLFLMTKSTTQKACRDCNLETVDRTKFCKKHLEEHFLKDPTEDKPDQMQEVMEKELLDDLEHFIFNAHCYCHQREKPFVCLRCRAVEADDFVKKIYRKNQKLNSYCKKNRSLKLK